MKFLLPITVLVGATWAAADYSRDSKDTRLSFSDFNNWSLPRLRTGSKRKVSFFSISDSETDSWSYFWLVLKGMKRYLECKSESKTLS